MPLQSSILWQRAMIRTTTMQQQSRKLRWQQLQEACWETHMLQQQHPHAFTINNQPPPPCNNLLLPPVHNIHIPTQQTGGGSAGTGGEFQQGPGGRNGGGHSRGGGRGGRRGGIVHTPYSTGGVPQFAPQFGETQQGYTHGVNTGRVAPVFAGRHATAGRGRRNADYSKCNKIYNNLNSVIPMALTFMTITCRQRAVGERWNSRRASHAKMHKDT